PDAGYKVLDVKVDNVSQNILANYEFTDVTDNHTIEAIFEKDTSTSIASGKHLKDKLNVYPIPFEGHLYIEGLDKGKALVTMYNINGTVVLEQTIETTGTLILEGLQNLEKGIYLINIQQEKRNSNIKVIK
ncbi:MAG: T9SS type A sorting domain-containing protein, partial [Bacteroidota bacterium]